MILVLYDRDLHNNKLTGPIPPQIGRLKRLKILYGSLPFLLVLSQWSVLVIWLETL